MAGAIAPHLHQGVKMRPSFYYIVTYSVENLSKYWAAVETVHTTKIDHPDDLKDILKLKGNYSPHTSITIWECEEYPLEKPTRKWVDDKTLLTEIKSTKKELV